MPRLNWNRRRKVHEPWYARLKPDREGRSEFKTGTSRDYSRFLADGIPAAKDDLQFAGYPSSTPTADASQIPVRAAGASSSMSRTTRSSFATANAPPPTTAWK